MALLGDKENAQHIFQQSLDVAQEIKYDELFIDIHSWLQALIEPTLYYKYHFYYYYKYRSQLSHFPKTLSLLPETLSLLRRSFAIFPLDYHLALHGIYCLQIAHVQQKNMDHYQKIQDCLEDVIR